MLTVKYYDVLQTVRCLLYHMKLFCFDKRTKRALPEHKTLYISLYCKSIVVIMFLRVCKQRREKRVTTPTITKMGKRKKRVGERGGGAHKKTKKKNN